MRWAPLYAGPDEDIETLLLKTLGSGGPEMAQFVHRFNANVSASGLAFAVTQEKIFAENKDKLILAAISSLLMFNDEKQIEAKFCALRRLISSKSGFFAFTSLPKFREQLGMGVIKDWGTN
jgi:DnaJ family protein C protein 13